MHAHTHTSDPGDPSHTQTHAEFLAFVLPLEEIPLVNSKTLTVRVKVRTAFNCFDNHLNKTTAATIIMYDVHFIYIYAFAIVQAVFSL